MKPLTAWGDPAIDHWLQPRLDRVVAAVAQQMGSDLAAVVLGGGFGRGEGGVLRRADGSLRVVNDFDFEVVYREPLGRLASKLLVQWRHRRELAALAERLARELDMKQVDLGLRGLSSFDLRVPRLADFDLFHGHRLLWGDADPCRRMAAFRPDQVPLFEGTWLLRNRGVGLVLARLYLDRGGELDAAEHENFYIEINKSALAMGDALWILSGRYDVSYEVRRRRFDELSALGCPAFDRLAPLYLQAAEYKLRPVAEPYPGQARDALWRRLASLHVEVFLWFESRRLEVALPGLAAWQAWADAQPGLWAASWLRQRIDRRLGTVGECPPAMASLRRDRLGSVACALGLLAARVDDPDDGWRTLARWAGGAPAAAGTWATLARGLLSALHPGGEVGRFLAATRHAA